MDRVRSRLLLLAMVVSLPFTAAWCTSLFAEKDKTPSQAKDVADLVARIEKLEARVVELERRCAGPVTVGHQVPAAVAPAPNPPGIPEGAVRREINGTPFYIMSLGGNRQEMPCQKARCSHRLPRWSVRQVVDALIQSPGNFAGIVHGDESMQIVCVDATVIEHPVFQPLQHG